MTNARDFDRYNVQLATQMQRIAELGVPLLNAIHHAQAAGVSPQIVSDAVRLKAELDGRPGDGALEVYRDLDENLKSTRHFLAQWRNVSHSTAQELVACVAETERALELMQSLVVATPADVLNEIKNSLSAAKIGISVGSSGRPNLLKLALPFLGPLAAIMALQLFGVGAMIFVAWGALLLYFKLK